jgi:hypothetical protein
MVCVPPGNPRRGSKRCRAVSRIAAVLRDGGRFEVARCIGDSHQGLLARGGASPTRRAPGVEKRSAQVRARTVPYFDGGSWF